MLESTQVFGLNTWFPIWPVLPGFLPFSAPLLHLLSPSYLPTHVFVQCTSTENPLSAKHPDCCRRKEVGNMPSLFLKNEAEKSKMT